MNKWFVILSNIILAVFMGLQAFHNLNAFLVAGHHLQITHFLLMVDLTLIAFFFLIRRMPVSVSWKPWDVLVAVVGTCAPFFFILQESSDISVSGVVLQILGISLSMGSVLSLNRSVGMLPANRGIQTKGLYRIVRHPLYASYFIFDMGYLVNNFSVYNLKVAGVAILALIFRIFAEEYHLLSDPAYIAYRKEVRWRMFPFLF